MGKNKHYNIINFEKIENDYIKQSELFNTIFLNDNSDLLQGLDHLFRQDLPRCLWSSINKVFDYKLLLNIQYKNFLHFLFINHEIILEKYNYNINHNNDFRDYNCCFVDKFFDFSTTTDIYTGPRMQYTLRELDGLIRSRIENKHKKWIISLCEDIKRFINSIKTKPFKKIKLKRRCQIKI